MSNCLPSLVASLPGIIIICGLIALFCIVIFDTTPARGQTRTVKFREPEKIECGICNAIAKPNAPQEDVEFDSDGLVFKVEKEIRPDSIVCLEVFPKERFVPGSKVWQVQLMTDGRQKFRSEKLCFDFPLLAEHFMDLSGDNFWQFPEER